MCLGIPGKVIDIWEESGTRMSTDDFGGTTKTVCLDEASANETLKMFSDLGILAEELGVEEPA